MTKSEAQTRSELIDQQLALSGWNVKDPTQVVEEFDILTSLPEGVAQPRTPYEGHQYGIVERYRGKLLGGDGKAWLVEVLDEWRWNDETAGAEGKTPDEYLRDVSRHAHKSPYANANFLKNSFLQGCKTVGLFEPIAKEGAAP